MPRCPKQQLLAEQVQWPGWQVSLLLAACCMLEAHMKLGFPTR